VIDTRTSQPGTSVMPRKKCTTKSGNKVSVKDSPIIGLAIAASNIGLNSTPLLPPIFRLPLEIRRIIYCFVIGERDVDIRKLDGRCHACEPCQKQPNCSTVRPARKTQRLQTFRTQPSPLAIAATCQQLYQEAMNTWYGKARFFFQCARCMKQFLEDIGDANRDVVRYIGYLAPGRPNDEDTKEVRDLVKIFASLRSLTIEDNGWWGIRNQREYHQKWIEESLETWKGVAHNLLKLQDRLDNVVLATKTLRRHQRNDGYPRRLALNYRELKLNRLTGKFATTISVVERDIEGALPWCLSLMRTPVEWVARVRSARFSSRSRPAQAEEARVSEEASEGSAS